VEDVWLRRWDSARVLAISMALITLNSNVVIVVLLLSGIASAPLISVILVIIMQTMYRLKIVLDLIYASCKFIIHQTVKNLLLGVLFAGM
jgi:hypothetical protein